ncbi:hypothetical protein BLNAU_1885 [Blattamonas nauphoetae]|uniref:Uncharacterized protein n=1 Tax=Blattamonas nauphoetae TaxID=2049346 RepID=A0ABQ9YI68_9EUKA|nr:hypothetical protein BLNAU_1885 [Blattamonas nauphoetae]
MADPQPQEDTIIDASKLVPTTTSRWYDQFISAGLLWNEGVQHLMDNAKKSQQSNAHPTTQAPNQTSIHNVPPQSSLGTTSPQTADESISDLQILHYLAQAIELDMSAVSLTSYNSAPIFELVSRLEDLGIDNNADLSILSCYLYSVGQQWDSAIEELESAMTIKPSDERISFIAAGLYSTLGNINRGQELFEKSVELALQAPERIQPTQQEQDPEDYLEIMPDSSLNEDSNPFRYHHTLAKYIFDKRIQPTLVALLNGTALKQELDSEPYVKKYCTDSLFTQLNTVYCLLLTFIHHNPTDHPQMYQAFYTLTSLLSYCSLIRHFCHKSSDFPIFLQTIPHLVPRFPLVLSDEEISPEPAPSPATDQINLQQFRHSFSDLFSTLSISDLISLGNTAIKFGNMARAQLLKVMKVDQSYRVSDEDMKKSIEQTKAIFTFARSAVNGT